MIKPIPQCYWVVPGKLIAGEYPRNQSLQTSPEKMNKILGVGVTSFIDLTEYAELSSYEAYLKTAMHYQFPIKDLSIPESPELTMKILDLIDALISDGEVVYLHCWGGIGRTGLIVGCWLSRHGGRGDDVLKQLEMLWVNCSKYPDRESPETIEQVQYILDWDGQ